VSERKAPIVDPSPTQEPIQAGSEEFMLPPAEASPQEILDLKPNKAKDATSGPDAQVSSTAYVHMTRPGGGEFLAPLANVAHYEAKGFTKGAVEEIPDFDAYLAEQAKKT